MSSMNNYSKIISSFEEKFAEFTIGNVLKKGTWQVNGIMIR